MTSPTMVTFGETMILVRADQIGPLASANTAGLSVGGAESNVAIAAHRLGVDACWIGRRGADALGDKVERTLRGEGIRVSSIIDPDAPTGVMFKERRTAISTNVWYYRSGSAGSRLRADDVPSELVRQADLLHITGITPLLSADARDATFHALDIAANAGTTISFDVNHRSRVAGGRDAGSLYRELAARADIVFAGADEAALLAPGVDGTDALARAVAGLGPAQVIIKLGEDGCVALIDGELFERPAVAVPVIDTVGAGDAFVAGYLARFLHGRTAEEQLAGATMAGAFACMVPGDWEGAPTEEELEAFGRREPVAR